MRIGAHVRAGAGLLPALERGGAIGAEVVQVFTQSPRAWKPSRHGPELFDAYRTAQHDHPTVEATFCHATYLVNLASPDPTVSERSRQTLSANLRVATGIGAAGLVLHVGSHRGAGSARALPAVARALLDALERVPVAPDRRAPCPILLENTAGAGATMGRTFEELAAVIDAAGGDERLGVCLDTQHLWASGVSFADVEEADAVVGRVAATVGLERLRCLHVNDSKVPRGAGRDRHENLAEGTIGEDALSALLGHPALQHVPAVLEVPGEGDGPRAKDVLRAREILERGLAARRRPA
ncbi:MAG TPA: deoxyribonuclease IV [Acidimicrobiales bacterium]|nr:deoxyribonuclease IV [Acidimicrobiales bacterium]